MKPGLVKLDLGPNQNLLPRVVNAGEYRTSIFDGFEVTVRLVEQSQQINGRHLGSALSHRIFGSTLVQPIQLPETEPHECDCGQDHDECEGDPFRLSKTGQHLGS